MSLKPPFCRQGNKYNLREKILAFIPEHETFVDLFVGSGAIFFNKEKVKYNILNDLDKDVIQRFKLLKNVSTNPNDYPQNLKTLRSIKKFYNEHVDKANDTVENQLVLEKIKSCSGYNNIPVQNESSIYKNYNPIINLEKLKEIKLFLKNTRLLNKNYETVVKTYDSPTTFFFADPPYENTDKTFYNEKNTFDYAHFANVLSKIQGYVMITLNDSSNIRSLFKDFEIKSIKAVNNWQNAPHSSNKKQRKELIIMNYTLE